MELQTQIEMKLAIKGLAKDCLQIIADLIEREMLFWSHEDGEHFAVVQNQAACETQFAEIYRHAVAAHALHTSKAYGNVGILLPLGPPYTSSWKSTAETILSIVINKDQAEVYTKRKGLRKLQSNALGYRLRDLTSTLEMSANGLSTQVRCEQLSQEAQARVEAVSELLGIEPPLALLTA